MHMYSHKRGGGRNLIWGSVIKEHTQSKWQSGRVKPWLSQHQILQCVLGNTGLNESRPEMGLWPLFLGQSWPSGTENDSPWLYSGLVHSVIWEVTLCGGGWVGTNVPPWRHLSSEKTPAINSRAQSTKLQTHTAHFPQKLLGWKSA